jgi:ABC-type multidrug transport system fused ATPase/permease subunit
VLARTRAPRHVTPEEHRLHIPLREYWDLLSGHIRPQRGRFAWLAVLLLSGIGLQLVVPQIVRTFIDATSAGVSGPALLYAALGYVGVVLVQQGVAVAATYVGENVAWTATNALRGELARHCLSLDLGFHGAHTPGELIERIDGDVSQLATFFSQLVIFVLGNILLLAGVVLALSFEDVRLGLAFALLSAFALAVLNRLRGIAVPHYRARRQAEAALFGYLEEQLAGTEDICANGATEFSLRGIYRHQAEILRHDRAGSLRRRVVDLSSDGLLTAGQVAALWAGYRLHLAGAFTLGTVYLLVQYIGMLRRPLRELTRQVQDLQTVGASVGRLAELREVESQLHDGPGAAIPPGPLSLSFDRVDFAYLTEEPVLHDVSFSLRPGTVLGLLGRTGSGKTTLGRLVFRLYDPGEGTVQLGQVDLRQPTLRHLRQRVALVTQEVQLFQGTMRDNLTFFDPTVPDARIEAAIEGLGLGEWYASLPEGLDTQLGAGSRGLSAGEAQLLALTRVFLRDPGLVVLDEASSRLDPATERLIERAIDRLLRGRTAIVIAHRLATVGRADEIMILEDGRVREHGARTVLARDPASRFYALLQAGLEEVLA